MATPLHPLSLHDALPIFELLRTLEIPFTVAPADVDETRVVSPALAKADAVATPGTVTLAADTEVLHDGERYGKPDRKSTRLNSSHMTNSYAVFCLKKKR